MKKLILIISVLGLIANNISAQENETDPRYQLQLGAKVGFNYSNVYDSKGEGFNADPKFGFAAGAFLAIPFGQYLGFQPELLFSQKGFKATGNVLGINYDFTRTTSFIDIPLLLQLKPGRTVTLLIGPQYSYLINQKDDFTNTTIEQDFKNDNIRKNIMCFVVGIDICPKNILIGARAGWDIQNNNGDGTSTVPRYKNVWYQVMIGIRL